MTDLLLSLADWGALWGLAIFAGCSVLLAVGEHRREDAEARARAHEQLAHHRLYPDAGPGRKHG